MKLSLALHRYERHGGFGIWAVKWSADGREILAGTGDSSLYVYDMTERKVGVICYILGI